MRSIAFLFIFVFSLNMWGATSACFSLFTPQIQGFNQELYFDARESFLSKKPNEMLQTLINQNSGNRFQAEEVIAFFDALSGGRNLNFHEQMSQIKNLRFKTSKTSTNVRASKWPFMKPKITMPERLNGANAREFQRFAVEIASALQRHQISISTLFFKNNRGDFKEKISQKLHETSQNLDHILSQFSHLNGIERSIIPTNVPRKKAISLLYRGISQLLLPISFRNYYYKDFMIEANPIRSLNLFRNHPHEMKRSINRNAQSHWISRNASLGVYSIILALSIMPIKNGIQGIIEINRNYEPVNNAASATLEQKTADQYMKEALEKLE